MRIKNLIFSLTLVVLGIFMLEILFNNYNNTIYIIGILFVLGIWIARTIGRTRYWLDRGTRGEYYENCPKCNEKRYRVDGDWILKCYECNWKTGYPVLRWFRKSVPIIQFKRSIKTWESFIFGFLVSPIILKFSLESGILLGYDISNISILDFNFEPIIDILGLILFILTVIFIVIIIPKKEPKIYCLSCGQYLGEGEPQPKCERCGSNRTTRDPDAGHKKQIEHHFKDN